MKIEDMKPGKLYRVTRIDTPQVFSHASATGHAILHAPGEPGMQSCFAVSPEDCSPCGGTPSTVAPVRVLLFDADAQRTGPFRTFYDPATGERFRVTDLTLASLPTTQTQSASLASKMRGPRFDSKPLGPRVPGSKGSP